MKMRGKGNKSDVNQHERGGSDEEISQLDVKHIQNANIDPDKKTGCNWPYKDKLALVKYVISEKVWKDLKIKQSDVFQHVSIFTVKQQLTLTLFNRSHRSCSRVVEMSSKFVIVGIDCGHCSSVFVTVKSTQVGVMEMKMLVMRAMTKMTKRKLERNIRSQRSTEKMDHQMGIRNNSCLLRWTHLGCLNFLLQLIWCA